MLALALAGGFAWYERIRPDARIVALVATLAAFAALGRIAFAALPNVKPTTDIVLISGYALGGAPGFVVGAVAGLSSNFFFGQGPWTPWQMAAWGATGVLGAGLAAVTRGRIRRLPLALVCGLVGYLFAAFQDFGDWITYSDHSLAQLEVYVGKGTGFDVVHAIGCVAFALAIGPALARSVKRFAARLQVVWVPAKGSGLLLAAIVCAGLSTALSTVRGRVAEAQAAASPVGYLLSAQNADGGFGGAPGTPSSELYSGWAALGLAAAGRNPGDVSRGARTLLDYVSAAAGGFGDTGSLERTILVLRAAGARARALGGRDLVAMLRRRLRHDGSVAEQVNLTAFAVLALRACGITSRGRTISWLARQQDRDGGFSFATAGPGSDVDDTGAALEALAGAAGPAARARAGAVRFIRRQQNRDGGFPAQPGAESNAQSTAWAIQGLLAAGVDPAGLHRRGARSPLLFLRSLISADGHVRYSRGSDQTPVWVTAQTLMALARKPLPLAPVPALPHQRRRAHHRAHRRAPRAARRPAAPRASASSKRRRARARPHRRPWKPPLAALAADAGVAAAVVFAPIGLG